MNFLKTTARRVPALRYCILQHHLRERQKIQSQRWEYRRAVFSVIGQAIWTWAGIEIVIDHLITWYHPIAGAETIQPDLPVTFDRKMDYINKMARDPKWADGGQTLRWMRTESKRLNKLRKVMAHGVPHHISPLGLDWAFQIRTFKGPNSTIERYGFTLDDLTNILSQMSAHLSVISPWVANVTELNAKPNISSTNSG